MKITLLGNTTNKTTTRNSGIDLIKIIAILLICLHHANLTLRNISEFPTFSLTNIITVGINPFGTLGNILFVLCSSFFLVDHTKTRTDKALNILFDSLLISITILIGFIISGETLSSSTIVHQIFPSVFNQNWFVPCYVIFYLLAPIIVIGLKHLNKKQHLALLTISLVVYGVLSFFDLAPVGSNLLKFFFILNIVAFTKWHIPSISSSKKINGFTFAIGMILFYGCYFGFLTLRRNNPFFSIFDFQSMYSPLLVIPLLSLVNIFSQMKFHNNTISYLSTCSLFVYVIHDNFLLRTITRVNYYNWAMSTFGENLALVYMLICGLFMFVAGFILAITYKETLGRLTKIVAIKINSLLNKGFDKLSKKVFKEEQ